MQKYNLRSISFLIQNGKNGTANLDVAFPSEKFLANSQRAQLGLGTQCSGILVNLFHETFV